MNACTVAHCIVDVYFILRQDSSQHRYMLGRNTGANSCFDSVFVEKYDYVGKLLRPGEQPVDYELEEEEGAAGRQQGDAKKSN